jgi:hypothetical protein
VPTAMHYQSKEAVNAPHRGERCQIWGKSRQHGAPMCTYAQPIKSVSVQNHCPTPPDSLLHLGLRCAIRAARAEALITTEAGVHSAGAPCV